MKIIFYLAITLLMISTLSAQNKTLTVYYGSDSTKIVNIANSDSIVIFICGASKVRYGSKDYNTVLIGNQCWLKENLDIGIMIPGSSNQTNNSTIEKYCYNNDPNNCTTYGGLYQWNEAMQYITTEGAQGICPTGWHIPTYVELQTLKTVVNNSGNALKEIGQGTGSGEGTNTSGFSDLLAGDRHYSGGFYNLGLNSYTQSSTEYNSTFSNDMSLYQTTNNIGIGTDHKTNGVSVRCLKDQ